MKTPEHNLWVCGWDPSFTFLGPRSLHFLWLWGRKGGFRASDSFKSTNQVSKKTFNIIIKMVV